jgi:hypothetical protein
VDVEAVRSALGGLAARIVDLVEEVLERARHVADVGRGTEHEPVGGQHIGRVRDQRRPDLHLDPFDLVGTRPGEDRVEQLLQRRRGGVVDDEQAGHGHTVAKPEGHST